MTHKGNTSIIIQMKVFDDQITLWNGGTLPLSRDSEARPIL